MQALQHRADGKLYRIQTPQTPIARTKRYNTYKMDEFPSGMNMIVAVLAYTGEPSTHQLFHGMLIFMVIIFSDNYCHQQACLSFGLVCLVAKNSKETVGLWLAASAAAAHITKVIVSSASQ